MNRSYNLQHAFLKPTLYKLWFSNYQECLFPLQQTNFEIITEFWIASLLAIQAIWLLDFCFSNTIKPNFSYQLIVGHIYIYIFVCVSQAVIVLQRFCKFWKTGQWQYLLLIYNTCLRLVIKCINQKKKNFIARRYTMNALFNPRLSGKLM